MKTAKGLKLLLLILLLICPRPAQAAEVRLLAAASLREVVDELANCFARKNPGFRLVKTYGGTGSLARQLENGAPADIFISANLPWVAYLKKKGLLPAQGTVHLTSNTLVFAGSAGTKASSLRDLLKLERIAIGSPKSVPAGEYAMQALQKAGLDRPLAEKLVMARDVREALMYAERGEVDGALVYRTDALQAGKVSILFTLPQDLYSRISYPMALTQAGVKNREAQAFFRYLQGSEAKGILARYGFAAR